VKIVLDLSGEIEYDVRRNEGVSKLEGWVLVKSHGIKKDKNSEKNI
jgi:hypothetical protein